MAYYVKDITEFRISQRHFFDERQFAAGCEREQDRLRDRDRDEIPDEERERDHGGNIYPGDIELAEVVLISTKKTEKEWLVFRG
ncbi:hypothetical protein EVAR_7426_1 [Eumeta japonica]|uniref:Uncharacterized protein n=1 Tax=Eumeta variegata TaxID=151549 RepID=A0A4C1V6E3_EUMVA|nr:hypothetical protein EVAR_7426_1 [Eumeta japonica]